MTIIICEPCEKFRATCIYCGCEFEYDLDDVHDKYEPFVKCPNCDTHNVHDAERNGMRYNVTDLLLREKDKEIEGLRGEVDALCRLNVERDIVADAMLTEEARAEAVDEFVERVKKAPDILDVNGYLMIGVDIVELIADEMKGNKE